ncbi:MAG: histidinol-phosphatase [Desulforegulaceae bacterium]|nr:histidinol-phosphatase [Desulforegulaceae bacterium]
MKSINKPIYLSLKKLIKTDYHIHTKFCNHAKKSMEAYIEQAVQKGILEILFLDHLTLCEKDFKNSMTIKEVPLYFYTIKNLKKKFKDKIIVKCGLETDFHPDYFEKTEKICKKFDFDMIGASVHFVKGFNIASRSKRQEYQHIDHNELVASYFENMENMLEFDFFDTVCHFDLIYKFFENPVIDNKISKTIDRLLDKMKEKNKSMEVNTSGFYAPLKRQYPSEKILKKCLEKKIDITTGSDSHLPEEVGRHFNEAFELLKKLNFKSVSGYEKRTKYEIPL